MTLFDHLPQSTDQRELKELVQIEQAGSKSVVDVMIVIGDIIGNGRELGFKAGPACKVEVPFRVGLGHCPGLHTDRTVVLGEPLQALPAQVQAREVRIGRFERGDDADGMSIVIEPAGFLQGSVKRVFACMAEGRVTKVMSKAERFGEVFIETQGAGHRAPDLGNFETVGQPDPVMVAIGGDEHLSLVAKPSERDRVDQAVAVALENVPRSART